MMALVLVCSMQVVVLAMVIMTFCALLNRHAMGSAQESRFMSLGTLPNTQNLAEKLGLLSAHIMDIPAEERGDILKQLSIYDLRKTQNLGFNDQGPNW
ncbi:unnamed protein product, partial [Effrenium voratum]